MVVTFFDRLRFSLVDLDDHPIATQPKYLGADGGTFVLRGGCVGAQIIGVDPKAGKCVYRHPFYTPCRRGDTVTMPSLGESITIDRNTPLWSAEQLVREILAKAIEVGLVAPNEVDWDDPDPQCRSAGELVFCSNLVADYQLQLKSHASGE